MWTGRDFVGQGHGGEEGWVFDQRVDAPRVRFEVGAPLGGHLGDAERDVGFALPGVCDFDQVKDEAKPQNNFGNLERCSRRAGSSFLLSVFSSLAASQSSKKVFASAWKWNHGVLLNSSVRPP